MSEGRSARWQQQRWAALEAVEVRVQAAPAGAGRVHAQLLRDLVELASAYSAQGQSLSVSPQVGLLLRCSGAKADRLLAEASTWVELPDGLAALEQGLLTVEQSAVAARELGRVPDLATRLVVWRRLLERLRADLAAGSVLPPPRLRELVRRWVLELAAKDAEEEREQAAAERRVEYRRRADGLTDIVLFGVASTLAQAVLLRVRELSTPVSLFDDRTADQRRLDAAVDLLLGRVGQPPRCVDLFGPSGAADPCGADPSGRAGLSGGAEPSGAVGPSGAAGPSGAPCGCLPGTPVPCGARLLIHVPLGAALGITDEVAELVGHGPLEPDVLRELLLAAPELRAVHVDADGVPVAVSDTVRRPERRDPHSVREALLDLATEPPGRRYPRHADDHHSDDPADLHDPDLHDPDLHDPDLHDPDLHDPDPHDPGPDGSDPHRPDAEDASGHAGPAGHHTEAGPQGGPAGPGDCHGEGRDGGGVSGAEPAGATDARIVGQWTHATAGAPHPPDRPGPYRPSRRLRRLVQVRAPRCEFPGCGMPSEACDAEHDEAWPLGPTCACQLGPCCRRHHRTKQEGWLKQRLLDCAVRWTSPTGRSWTSPAQHPRPAAPLRPLRAVPSLSPWDELDPFSTEQLLWELDGRPDDPVGLELRALDVDPDSTETPDLLGDRINAESRWSLELDDPYGWTDVPDAVEPLAP